MRNDYWVIYNTQLNQYAGSDVDWGPICDTTLWFHSKEDAEAFLTAFSECFYLPDIRVESVRRVYLEPESTGP